MTKAIARISSPIANAVVPIVILVVTLAAACSVGATTKPCATLEACTASNRSICYGHTTTALMAQFFGQDLLYTVKATLPAGSSSATEPTTASDQDFVSRIAVNMM